MKKKLLVLGVALLLVLSMMTMLAGCQNNNNSNNNEENQNQEQNNANSEDEDEVFQSRPIKFLSIWAQDQHGENGWLISELSKDYAETVEGFELDFEYVAIDQLDQKVKILLSSDELPEVCTYESGSRLKSVIESDKILDVDKTFTDLGIRDCLDPAAVSLLENLVDGIGLYDAPLGLNFEGFWYNKALFEEAGLDPESPPETWDEFMDACQALKDAGITPIVQGGSDNWPMTRVLNGYVVRSIGLDAVGKAVRGEAHFTDQEYIDAAAMFQDMAEKGYFAEGMNTIDPGTATSMLMNGQAAINYDGSWKTANLNSEDNTAGEGIGFFNVPTVNDSSTLKDYSMNCGNILMFSSKAYDEQVGHWMQYVFPKLGDFAMKETGAFKGYKVNEMPEDLPYYTELAIEHLNNAEGAFLWFEAKMNSEASTQAQQNISLLYNGDMTPEEYMQTLEDAAAKARE